MSKVRVYEVAKQLNMDQKTLVAHFQSMGIGDVRNHMSAVEVDAVERLKRHLERQKTPEVVEEKIRFGVVKRRSKATDEPVPAARPSGAGGAAASTPTPVPAARPSARGSSVADITREHEEVVIKSPPPPASAPAKEAPVAPPSTRAAAAPASVKSTAAKSSASAAEPAKAPKSSKTRAVPASDLDFDGDDAKPAAAPAPVEAPVAAAPVEAPAEAAPSRRSARGTREAVEETESPHSAAPVTQVSPKIEPAVEAPKPSTRGAKAAPAVVEPEPVKAKPVEAVPPPPPPAPVEAPPPPSAPPPAAPVVASAPQRPSSPPRTGIDVWQGRPGVPMPQRSASSPPGARRTTYDPRASNAPARPGGPMSGFPNRPGQGNRPGQRPQFGRPRPGMQSSASKRPPTMMEMAAHKKVIKIEENVSLQKLAGMMSLKVTDVLMKLLSMGMTGVNINSTIDADTAKILASEFGWTVEDVAVSEESAIEAAMGLDDKSDAEHLPRPPIVTVMGHVDHGKTSLLDRIRKATVAAGEAGGITQHIGAYRVETSRGTLAFLDTPGHEAFTAMRARGAQVTDIVILVVAADDGVMPQTKEAIAHAQSAKVPIIVAVNKIDKPAADPDRVKRDLANLGLTPEEWGGETLFCHVSALTGEGVDHLLESVVLQSEVLELVAAPKRRANGVVIEALLDRGRGPVARVMVQDGTLRQGDILIAGPAWGKVRAMTDEFGRSLASAGPSTPVEVLGLNEVPSAGDPVHAVKDAKTAEEIAEQRRKKQNVSLIPKDVRNTLETIVDRLKEGEQLELKLIIKGDVQGSVEAVGQALAKLSTAKVKVTIVHAAVGAITEGDVNLAIASKAIIVGFNVRPAGKASSLAEGGGIEIRLYNIIYNAVDDIKSAMEGLLPKTKIEKALGTAEIRKVFKITKVGIISGCYVTSGSVKRGAEARLVRDNIVVYTGKISSLRRVKDDVKEVAEGTECGISLEAYSDVKEGDIIEAFEIEEVKQKLD